MLKNLLVHVPSERSPRPVIDGAISLAAWSGAHLDAVSVGYEFTNVGLAMEGGTAVAAVFEIERQTALARANAALTIFESEAKSADISYGCHPFAGPPIESIANVSGLARLSDLTIVLQPEPQHNVFDNVMSQEVLFESGGPVLFIPYTHQQRIAPKRVGIAWDGSRLAARALRDAEPFLARAETISIISINDTRRTPAEPSVEALSACLARYGAAIRIQKVDTDSGGVQPAILSIAADHSLDLIVMGGYGHSRLQERILGGVTRDMLYAMTVPTLMSH